MFKRLIRTGWIQQGEPGKNALFLSILLALIEVLLWILLGWAKNSSTGKPFPLTDLLEYLTVQMGGITMAVITTFYVVFTYYLLQTSTEQNRRAAEPFVILNWRNVPEPTPQRIHEIDQVNKERLLTLTGLSSLDDLIQPLTPLRYMVLEIVNIRETPLDWVDITLHVSAQPEGEGIYIMPSRNKIELKNLNLTQNKALLSTVLDLALVPPKTAVTIEVLNLRYGPADSQVICSNHSGISSFSAPGAFNIRKIEPRGEVTS